MKFGRYEVQMIDAGRFKLDGGAMFGVVPRLLWEKKKPADTENRVQMATNLLIIKGEDRCILLDTGLGTKMNEKFRKIYAVDYSVHSLEKSLEAMKIRRPDITDVLLTHLHFDHAGGSTFYDPKGNLQPTFPNARYYIQKHQLAWAQQKNEKDRASYFPENYQPLLEAGRLELLEGPMEIFPDIELLLVNGHTVNQQIMLIHGGDQKLLYAGDLIPTHAHISIPWIMAYDLYPLTTIEEKKEILKRAVEEEWLIFFEHDPDVHCCKVVFTEKGVAPGEIVPIT